MTSRRAGSAGWQLCSARLPGSQRGSSRRCRVRSPCLARAASCAARASWSSATPEPPRTVHAAAVSVGGRRGGAAGLGPGGAHVAAAGLGSGRLLQLEWGETPCPGQPRSRDKPGAEPPLGLFTNTGLGAAVLLRPLAGSPILCRLLPGQAGGSSLCALTALCPADPPERHG